MSIREINTKSCPYPYYRKGEIELLFNFDSVEKLFCGPGFKYARPKDVWMNNRTQENILIIDTGKRTGFFCSVIRGFGPTEARLMVPGDTLIRLGTVMSFPWEGIDNTERLIKNLSAIYWTNEKISPQVSIYGDCLIPF